MNVVFSPGRKPITGEEPTDPFVARPPKQFEWVFSPGPISGVRGRILEIYYINFWTRDLQFWAETPYTLWEMRVFYADGSLRRWGAGEPKQFGWIFPPGPILAPSE